MQSLPRLESSVRLRERRLGMVDPGLSTGTYEPRPELVVAPKTTDNPGIVTAEHSAGTASAVSSTQPTATGPVTGRYEPNWSATFGIEIG